MILDDLFIGTETLKSMVDTKSMFKTKYPSTEKLSCEKSDENNEFISKENNDLMKFNIKTVPKSSVCPKPVIDMQMTKETIKELLPSKKRLGGTCRKPRPKTASLSRKTKKDDLINFA